ncbi:MAG: hybrid sensor histidine kinase/response regulator [Leptolyngbyaceae cyanobacterium SM1_1_3]|nr:hybrid sensor histidine kinase/response regulator [Leptolyngbyaceae cyanobacterium SM1_1_3]NJN01524.1 hybrid sensor histidine kinase/response regulator [Leptolyngbyaceae cyanobacterium RM1_1_2]
MSKTKELEIKLQFLDEAQAYLGDLESALIGIAHGQVATDKLNAALRAAHSIKGGAAMMGYTVLSQFAHQLEDSFKVLKVQKHQLETDAQLEQLLLSAVDCLSQVIEWNRQQKSIEDFWLEQQAQPLFEQLHQRLGDPQAEDVASMLSPEEGQDIVPMLFETEVEACLQRLEAILADPEQPCLSEEVMILAQELEGLGEMLQLPAFSALCQSVAQQLEATPERYEAIARLAIAAWRRSQALVLTGQIALLPTALAKEAEVDKTVVTAETDLPAASTVTVPIIELEDVIAEVDTLESDSFELDSFEFQSSEFSDLPEFSDFSEASEKLEASDFSKSPVTAHNFSALPTREPATVADDDDEVPESTVRVSVKRLNALNDLMGELTIERNSLTLNLNRLRSLLDMLKQRVQTLEAANNHLRSTYDQGTPQEHLSALAHLPASDSSARLSWASSAALPQSSPAFKGAFDVLEMDSYSDLHLLSQEMMETIVQIQEVTSDVELELEETEQTGRNFNKTGKQLQNGLTQVRMRPLGDILERFPRALRELCLQHGKEAQLKVLGGHTLVDRNILETLADPLMHLLRNAFDHGLEDPQTRIAHGKPRQGLIQIRATHRHNRTIIFLSDDGRGISLNKIRQRAARMGLDADLLAAATEQDLLSLIFEPGFSTSTEVTDLSGRGVGMDVVRSNLKQVRGEISVATEAGQGTTFTLSVPLTLSVARILLAESQNMALAIPTDALEEILVLPPEAISAAALADGFTWGNRRIPLLQLADWLTFNGPRPAYKLETPPAIDALTVLVVNHGGHCVGLQVERCWGEQEVAIRRVEGDLPLPPGFSNCTILGDGRVVPLLSIPELLYWISSNQQLPSAAAQLAAPLSYSPAAPLSHSAALAASAARSRPSLLIVDDSINVRRFLALTLEKAGYRVEQARDGQDALDKLLAGLAPQVVICDIEMPRLDGFGFLAKAKADDSLRDIPVIMLTSRSGQKHRQLALSLGATAYFSKPYNEQILLQTLDQLIHLTA